MGLSQSYYDYSDNDILKETQNTYDITNVDIIGPNCSNVTDINDLISNIFVIKECVQNIRGQDANSASASDVLFLDFNNNSKIPPLVMKLFISNDNSLYGIVRSSRGNDPTKNKIRYNKSFHITNTNDVNDTIPIIETQIYELYVYREKILPLVTNDICPFFVDYYGGNIDINEKRIRDFLVGNSIDVNNFYRNLYTLKITQLPFGKVKNIYFDNTLPENSGYKNKYNSNGIFDDLGFQFGVLDQRRLSLSTADKNQKLKINGGTSVTRFVENKDIYTFGTYVDDTTSITPETYFILFNFHEGYMRYGNINNPKGGRSAIKQFLIENSLTPNSIYNQKFGYILTQSIPKSYEDILKDKLGDLGTNYTFDKYNRYLYEIKLLLFMICIGCASMFYSRLVHNDFHYGNARVEEYSSEEEIIYYLYDKVVKFKTNYIPKIYDFDRGYAEPFKNELLKDPFYINQASQINKIIEKKDFVKFFGYTLITIDDSIDSATDSMSLQIYKRFYDDIKNWVSNMIINIDSRGYTRKTFDVVYAFTTGGKIPNTIERRRDKFSRGIGRADLQLLLYGKPTNSDADLVDINDYKTMIINMINDLGIEKYHSDYEIQSNIDLESSRVYYLSDKIFHKNGKISRRKLNSYIQNVKVGFQTSKKRKLGII